MGVTNLDSLELANTLTVTGTTTLSGVVSTNAPNTVTVAGTTIVGGIFTASASGKQSTMTKLNVTGTARVSGIFSASASGKQSTMTKLDVTGTTRVSGLFSATASGKSTYLGLIVVPSAANAMCGRRSITTAATTAYSIATTRALTSSRIFVTPRVSATAAPAKVNCFISSVNSGTSFSVKLNYGSTPTGVTGVVNWMIINK